MDVRCPYCHTPVDVIADDQHTDLTCENCGSTFSLLSGESTVSYQAAGQRKVEQFQLIELVGRGQYGDVWKARDTKLDRFVAVKIPRKEELSKSEAEFFLREARAAAQLKHPHIVHVHEAGRDGETLYIVSDFIEGASLKEWLAERRLTAHEAADLTVKIASALHHAHENGVVHRDLKPGNVMIDLHCDPHVMDFGMAKRDSGEVTMTMDGKILGTPSYMPPEQARGEGHRADGRADVYSLGVMLFELLTGERPFRGGQRMLIMQILNEPPPSPRKLEIAVPRDLETICLKCLEKDPGQRYQSARELADDLSNWQEGRPITARPIGVIGRLGRWSRRKPGVATLTVLSLVLAVAVIVGGPILYYRILYLEESLKRRESEKQLRKVVSAKPIFQSALMAARSGRWREALDFLKDAEEAGYADEVELRLQRIRCLRAMADYGSWSAEIAAVEKFPDLGRHRGRFLMAKVDRLRFQGSEEEAQKLTAEAIDVGLPVAETEYASGLLAETTTEAVEHFRKAITADPSHQKAGATLVATLVLLGRRDEARVRARVGLALFPSDSIYPLWLALIAALEQNRPEFDKWLKRIGPPLDTKHVKFIRSALASTYSTVTTLSTLDQQTALSGFALMQNWTQLQAMKNEIRIAAGKDPVFAGMATSLASSLPPAFDKAIAGFKTLNLTNIGPLLTGNVSPEVARAFEHMVAVNPEGTVPFLHAALLVRANKHRKAERKLVEAQRLPAMIAAVPGLARRLAPTAAYVYYQRSGRKQQDINRAVGYVRKLPDADLLNARFAEVFLFIANEAKDFALAQKIAAEMTRRLPRDVKWKGYLMNLEFYAGNIFRAKRLADEILKIQPDHADAKALVNDLFEKRIQAALRRIQSQMRTWDRPVRARKPKSAGPP